MTEVRIADSYKRNWGAALRALRKLLANGDDTHQVFIIMRSLNGTSTRKGYDRLLQDPAGARMAYDRVELAERLSDPDYVATFAPGTLGAAYRDFLTETGYTAAGLVEVSNIDNPLEQIRHPYAWFGRRTRDVHDLWHVLTGYKADETLGEAALVAFSYAQTGGLGWAWIGAGAALKSLRETKSTLFAKGVWEGYRHGKQAHWLLGEDWDALLHQPIDEVRARLNIREPIAYRRAQRELGAALASYASKQKAKAEAQAADAALA